jgi:hypothetical protein
MSIIDENGNQIMRVGMVHKIMAGACVALISAQTVALLSWGAWVTSTVSQHSIDIAVFRSMRVSYSATPDGSVSAVSNECFDK